MNTIPQNMINSAAQGTAGVHSAAQSAGPGPELPVHYRGQERQQRSQLSLESGAGRLASQHGPGRFRGPQNNLTFGFHYHEADQTLTNAYPSVGGQTITHGYDVPIGYVRSFGRLINTFRVEYNLSTIDTQNLYAYNTNVTGNAGH